ncbi:GntR family transcriptional regulator [Allopontixanthobacter sp.]|uniref:GntR family transcriptional regulator n=1 Tax=Allopontixanthobacter sp. TaxID=2906452 RepID=UPI002ABCEBB2|nr:GntR family transcriptional regulator [Allopontixanthobacter sp.]MDZ4308854.1 GntR family transcriptional regulator [Allopontixanthobacter sp.]
MVDMTLWNKGGNRPLYQMIAERIRAQIIDGKVSEGDALPSERELCELTQTSRVTVRKALQQLIDEDLLFRRQGSGTYVKRVIEAKNDMLSGFSESAKLRGEDASSLWLLRALASPTRYEIEMLGLRQSETVARLARVRMLDGDPLAVEHASVPAQFLPPLEEMGESLYDALARRGNRPVRGRQVTSASLATPTEAALLGIDENAAVLRIERVTYMADDTAVELTRSAYRGDIYQFISDLR